MKEYLLKLRGLCEKLEGEQYEIFYTVAKRFQDFKLGKLQTKNVTKKELLEHLVDKGYYKRVKGLPDDRKLRENVRELLKIGYPILASSKEGGYYIAETPGEVDNPQRENRSRALRLFEADRGYKRIRQLLQGQMEIE